MNFVFLNEMFVSKLKVQHLVSISPETSAAYNFSSVFSNHVNDIPQHLPYVWYLNIEHIERLI